MNFRNALSLMDSLSRVPVHSIGKYQLHCTLKMENSIINKNKTTTIITMLIIIILVSRPSNNSTLSSAIIDARYNANDRSHVALDHVTTLNTDSVHRQYGQCTPPVAENIRMGGGPRPCHWGFFNLPTDSRRMPFLCGLLGVPRRPAGRSLSSP